MPIDFYRGISDTDIRALVAYLRSVPAIERKVPDGTYESPRRPGTARRSGKCPTCRAPTRSPTAPTWGGDGALRLLPHAAQGGVPATTSTWRGAGGLQLTGPWGTSVWAQHHPDPETGIGAWTDQQVKDALGARA